VWWLELPCAVQALEVELGAAHVAACGAHPSKELIKWVPRAGGLGRANGVGCGLVEACVGGFT
jgi:hypothetical protein